MWIFVWSDLNNKQIMNYINGDGQWWSSQFTKVYSISIYSIYIARKSIYDRIRGDQQPTYAAMSHCTQPAAITCRGYDIFARQSSPRQRLDERYEVLIIITHCYDDKSQDAVHKKFNRCCEGIFRIYGPRLPAYFWMPVIVFRVV